MRRKRCKCGGFDENFEVADASKIGECGLDEDGLEHWHSESEEWIL